MVNVIKELPPIKGYCIVVRHPGDTRFSWVSLDDQYILVDNPVVLNDEFDNCKNEWPDAEIKIVEVYIVPEKVL